MNVTRFDPTKPLIIVPCLVWGPTGDERPLRLVVATGAPKSAIDSKILGGLGYRPKLGERSVRVARLRALGHDFTDFDIIAQEIPNGFEADGLIGLNILGRFNVQIRSAEGRILIDHL